ncbi:MAG: metallophosphoesterase family protein [Solirubrobacterales bacterium]|nr:metallophosphoesterase family protein [Solirubrobacterales bacterium]
MRTLVISDLHLGNRARHDVLRLAEPRARLLDAAAGVDRLVLLGDTVELMTRRPRRSMAIAEPLLRELGRRLGAGREVVVVPGNHDASLIRPWALQRGELLGLDEQVPTTATPLLREMTGWLAPAQVTVRYPGVWLADRVWATHGHYLDRHLLPESALGLPRGRLRGGRASPELPNGYELARWRSRRRRARRRSESLLPRLSERPIATVLETTAEALRRTALPRLPRLLMDADLAPVTAALIDAQMRHGSLSAMGQVVRRLGVQADWVVFGHVHRAGPLNGERWPEAPDGTRLLNTGSWLFEPVLLDRATPPHPYWPGSAALLEPARDPRVVGLLDGLDSGQLRGR